MSLDLLTQGRNERTYERDTKFDELLYDGPDLFWLSWPPHSPKRYLQYRYRCIG